MNIEAFDFSEIVEDTITKYREFWDRAWQGHPEKQICNFDGSRTDLEMLDYCEYELGHPCDSYLGPSLIWANVIKNHTPLTWGSNDNFDILLIHEDEGDILFSINIEEHISNIMNSDITQFELFPVATEKLLLDMIMNNYSVDFLADLKNLVEEYVTDGSYSESILAAVFNLYRSNSVKMDSFKELMNECG